MKWFFCKKTSKGAKRAPFLFDIIDIIGFINTFWEDEIAPKLIDGQNIIVAAHGNSLRALTKYIENISDEDIMDVEMATGEPVVYDLDENLNVVSKKKLN
ncbi:2,3-bisphosphoglycerate-dependent phosphoglycerate mutase [Latilactobacillus sakei]|uniref:2,3-bisphosphoglycerate-dependent phosphoglycerate mutase n=1 Tax=Latilactobacillus sakei TaxID=1599 RepID=UPI003F535794